MFARSVGSLLIALVLEGTALAQAFEGARLLGLGGCERALGSGNDAIYSNPAGIFAAPAYGIEIGYLDDARDSDRRFNASIVDSQAGPVAGGIAYTYSERRPDDLAEGDLRLAGHRIDLALAGKLGESVTIGGTARYMRFDFQGSLPDGEDAGFRELTVDAGLQLRVADGLALGVAGYNLTNSDQPELPIAWGAGIGYRAGAFSIEADVVHRAKIGNALFGGGMSYIVANLIPFRAAMTHDSADDALWLSFGAGIIYQRFGFDLGYRQRVDGGGRGEDGDGRLLGAAMRLMFF